MHRDRMEMIRDHLRDNVKDSNFNLSTWAGSRFFPYRGEDNLCGTVACVMGHATTIPKIKELGLRLERGPGSVGLLYYEDLTGFKAVSKFLDISEETTDHLFYAENYPNAGGTTRKEVIARINEYLENNSSSLDKYEENYL